jgi:hypothetical protein
MPTAVAAQYIGSRMYIRSWDHDPGATTAVIAGPDGGTTKRVVDMSEFNHLMVVAKPNIVGGGGLTLLEIIGSAAAAMSSPVVVKAHATTAADALDDQVVLEITAAEATQLDNTLRYFAARLTMATATDEATVTYIACGGREYGDMTATVIT